MHDTHDNRNHWLVLVFASLFLISLNMISHDAFADMIISDQSSCTSTGNVWDNTTNSCTVTNFSSDYPAGVGSGEILSCSGIVLKITQSISIEGTLDVKPDCTVDDYSFTTSNGTIINEGKFNNFGGIEVTNIFNNTGIFNNNSTFQNYYSGFPTVLNNSGIMNNYRSIGNADIINNYGIINNYMGAGIANMDLISNKIGGTINNNGIIDILPYFVQGVRYTFQNGTVDNFGSINNNADGTIDNESIFINECNGIINNNGIISGNQTIDVPCQTGNTTNSVQATQNLIDSVNEMNLAKGITNSLDVKLDATINSLSSGHNHVAVNQINSFINEIIAQTGKAITSPQADELISEARDIINMIP